MEEKAKDIDYYKFEKDGNINERIILMNIYGEMKEELLKEFNDRFLKTGNYFENSSKIKNKAILSLISTARIERYLGLKNTPLFIATTNPDNLIKKGIDYTSSVRGLEGRILKQAPFVKIGTMSSLTLPILLTQIATSLLILRQFGKIEQKIVKIGLGIQKLLKRNIADDIGYFSSSLDIINELEDELSYSKNFTFDMVNRLNILESNVKSEDEKYWTLIQDAISEYDEVFDLTRKETKDLKERKEREKKLKEKMKKFESNVNTSEVLDIKLWVCFSILSVRILLLRNKLILQENSEYFEISIKKTKEEIKNYERKWNKIIELCKMLQTIKELEAIGKNIGKERKILKEGLEKLLTKVDKEEINNIVKEAQKLSLEKEENRDYSLIYWKDELGEHSYYLE